MSSLLTTEKIIKLNDTSSVLMDTVPETNCPVFKDLLSLCPKYKNTVFVHGKTHDMPRFSRSFGVQYNYSGTDQKVEKLEDEYLIKLLQYVNKISSTNIYNGVLVNFYLNGEQYIAEHSDNTEHLVEGSDIYSFSFGATRDFILKSKTTKEKIIIPLIDKTMLIMKGETQKYYKHTVPKRLKVKEPRINITIRAFKTY